MAINLAPLATAQSTISTLGNLALVTPQTLGNNGIGIRAQGPSAKEPSFLFHYDGEKALRIRNEITDHYAEDNTALQDQIAHQPIRFATDGLIAEVSNVPSGVGAAALNLAKQAASKLVTLQPFLPTVSLTALIAYNTAASAYATAAAAVQSAVTTFATLTNKSNTNIATGIQAFPVQNKQQQAVTAFLAYSEGNALFASQLFTVQTPWCVLTNMAIESMDIVEEESTDSYTSFKIVFKRMKFSSDVLQTTNADGRAAAQLLADNPISHGVTTGTSVGPMQGSPSSGFSPSGVA